MQDKEYQHFNGMKQGFIISVVEGNGTEESPSREVHYIYTEDLMELGKIDKWKESVERNKTNSLN